MTINSGCRCPEYNTKIGGVKDSAHIKGKAADILALNAGAAIYVSGKAQNMQEGVKLAQDVLQSGLVKNKFKQLIELTNV